MVPWVKYALSALTIVVLLLGLIVFITPQYLCFSNNISIDSKKNIYVSGFCVVKKRFRSEVNQTVSLLTKINTSGVQQWTHRWSSDNHPSDRSKNLVISSVTDSFNNTYVLGRFEESITIESDKFVSKGLGDIFVVKVDPSGEIIWVKHFGGTSEDTGFDMDTDNTGNVYITGAKNDNAFTMKIDPAGKILWEKEFYGLSIAVDNAGNVYAAGGSNELFGTESTASRDDKDIFVGKFNTFGEIEWSKSFGNDTEDVGIGIIADNKGDVYIAGSFQGTKTDDSMLVVKMNSSGKVQWTEEFGDFDISESHAFGGDRIASTGDAIYLLDHFFHTVRRIITSLPYNSQRYQDYSFSNQKDLFAGTFKSIIANDAGDVYIAATNTHPSIFPTYLYDVFTSLLPPNDSLKTNIFKITDTAVLHAEMWYEDVWGETGL